MKFNIKDFKGIIIAVIISIACITSVVIGTNGLVRYRKSKPEDGLSVTGSASKNFTSDLIVWKGEFPVTASTTKEAYTLLMEYKTEIEKYLKENGVNEEEMIFSSVSIYRNGYDDYSENGTFKGRVLTDYTLTQSVRIESSEVDKIEKISRDISQLIDAGVEFNSTPPEYYYTKLDELKLEMIGHATDNAKQRALSIASNANSTLGDLITANLGVFQIVAQNSSDSYTGTGAFDTQTKDKSVFVTVKLQYKLKN